MIFVTIQLTGVEPVAGRAHQHVAAYGYRTADVLRRVVEVPLRLADAEDVMAEARDTGELPEVEVPNWAWSHIVRMGVAAEGEQG